MVVVDPIKYIFSKNLENSFIGPSKPWTWDSRFGSNSEDAWEVTPMDEIKSKIIKGKIVHKNSSTEFFSKIAEISILSQIIKIQKI